MLGVLLQVAVVEMPLLQVAFGTASLDAGHWASCVGPASIVLWFDEVRKIVLRGRARVF
ncbi:MAG: haloacid dehalogenase [Microbacteriaceae bacterium]|nr:haloacid dehalogenase [Microbacteriaceae bacterium]